MAGCRMITHAEAKAVLKIATDTRMKLLILVGLTFGTRISESLNLKFSDFVDGWVVIQALKKGNRQSYPVPKDVQRVIHLHRMETVKKGITIKDDTPLFLSRQGGVMTRQNASTRLKQLFTKAGILGKVNTHSLRKSFVTEIYNQTGKDIVKTRLYSRHASLGSLQHYIEASMDTELVKQMAWG